MKVNIYTDGGCVPNPGRGGWGYTMAVHHGSEVVTKEGYDGEEDTTNNRMEMMAPIMALRALPVLSSVTIYSDSQYVINGITKWMNNWIRRGWRTADGKQVKNADLWQELAEQAKKHRIRWEWVRGHSGIPGNERADMLAECGRLGITPDEMEVRVSQISQYVAGTVGGVA